MTNREPASQRRVLVVDDEHTISESIAARLRAEGYAVRTAFDGPSAVTECEAFGPDLVVLDVMLPGFDGLEVCRRIQASRAVPVLMLTARADETDLVIGLGVGADDYLGKRSACGCWSRGSRRCCAAPTERPIPTCWCSATCRSISAPGWSAPRASRCT